MTAATTLISPNLHAASRQRACASTPRPPTQRSIAPCDRTGSSLVRTGPNDVLVEVKAAAVNPSDVKAAIGLMPYAVFPRTPGPRLRRRRRGGPAHLVGKEVFGSSGDLGIRRDGTHATHLVVEADAVVEKPATISLQEAAGIGVPFVTALEGFRRAGLPQAGRDGAGAGLERQGRPGGDPDRHLARRPGDRRRAQARRLRGPRERRRRGHRLLVDRCRGAGEGADRRQGRRHRLQHGRRSLLSGRHRSRSPKLGRQIFIAAVQQDRRVRHLRLLPRPAHLCRASTPSPCRRSRRRTFCANSRPASQAAT